MFAGLEIMNRYVSSFTSVPPPLQPRHRLQTQPPPCRNNAHCSSLQQIVSVGGIYKKTEENIQWIDTYYSSVCTHKPVIPLTTHTLPCTRCFGPAVTKCVLLLTVAHSIDMQISRYSSQQRVAGFFFGNYLKFSSYNNLLFTLSMQHASLGSVVVCSCHF